MRLFLIKQIIAFICMLYPVKGLTFEGIYKTFSQLVFEKDLNNNFPQGSHTIGCSRMWDRAFRIQDSITHQVLSSCDKKASYLYRKYSLLSAVKKSSGKYIDLNIDADVIKKILEKILPELPEGYNLRSNDVSKQCDRLIKEFERQLNNIPFENESGEEVSKIESDYSQKRLLQIEIQDLITKFFTNVSLDDFKSLTKLIFVQSGNISSQKKDVDKIKKEFADTLSIRNVDVLNVKRINSNEIEAIVEYNEEFIEYGSADLSFILSSTLGDIERLIHMLKKVRKAIEVLDQKNVDNIPISSLFRDGDVVMMLNRRIVSKEKFSKIFPVSKRTLLKRVSLFTCKLDNSNWYISRIERLSNQLTT